MKAVDIHKRSVERCLTALALRRQGMTYKEIGRSIGLSGPVTVETARQAVLKGERIARKRATSAREKP